MSQDNRTHRFPRAARRALAGLLAFGMLLVNLPPPAALTDAPTDTFTGSATVAERFEFSPTDSMGTPRWGHTATRLADGRVLVAGGRDAAGTLGSAEVYNPTTGTWSATGSMSAARYWHSATLLPDGRVLVAGGGTPIMAHSAVLRCTTRPLAPGAPPAAWEPLVMVTPPHGCRTAGR